MKKNTLLFIACLIILAISGKSNAQSTLIHYWNFNTFTASMHTDTIHGVAADYSIHDTSKAKILYAKQSGTSSHYATYIDGGNAATADYDTVNLRMSATAGKYLRSRNPSDSMELLFYIPSVNYTHILLQYGTESSSTASGMTHQLFDYSTDSGATWRTSGLSKTTDSAWLFFHRTTVSLAMDSMVKNNAELVFRIKFSGHDTGTSGNNRFDNVTIEGDSIQTSTIAIAATPSTAICTGSGISFTATAVYTNVTPYYRWYVNGVSVGTDSANFTTTTLNNGDLVNCVLTDSLDGTVLAASNVFTVTVTPSPSAGVISGLSSVCPTANITLASTVSGGTWSSSNALATISTAGIVTGVIAGTDTITYSVSNMCGTADTTFVVTVSPDPNHGTISGLSSVCPNANITLASTVSGGTWSSSNASATVSTAGIVTGATTGTDTITYSVSNTCGTADTTFVVTVSPDPSHGTISGLSSVCPTANITLTSTVSGGSWSSSNSFATVSTLGVVTGTTAGMDTITYSVSNTCGAADTTFVVTISPDPSHGTISGLSSVCPTANITLTNTVSGGTWSSSNSSATVSTSGVVTGATAGTDTITYSVSNTCGTADTTFVVTISPDPNHGTISGLSSVCPTANIILSNTVFGGTWSSSNASATVSTAGVVTGVIAGSDTITYSVSNTCGTADTIFVVTVSPSPSAGTIEGSSNVCPSSSVTLTDAVSGGTWSISNGLATITTAGVVTAVTSGSDTVTYSVTSTCGSASSIFVLTISLTPSPGTISGSATACIGTGTSLSETISGGVWSTSTGNASVSTSGVVTGVTTGADTIIYTVTSCGTSYTTYPITVNALPSAGTISGSSTACIGSGTALSETVSGGAWSSNNANATISTSGIVTGVSAGADTITYTVSSCGTSFITYPITVDALPSAGAISGSAIACIGSGTTLSETISGGTWSSNNANATVSTLGIVTGVTAGADTITYTVSSCGTSFITYPITVNALPSAGTISGSSTACIGIGTTLSETIPGGVWSVSTGNASVSTSGTIAGVTSGADTIIYTVSSCGTSFTTYPITVSALPDSGTISGSATACIGSGTTLAETVSGGTWSSSNASATITTAGIVTGVTAGADTIAYIVGNSCGSKHATYVISVSALPSAGAISGSSIACIGSGTTLSETVSGGVWSTSNGNAFVSTSGILTGIFSGADTIIYTLSSCGTSFTTYPVTVSIFPDSGTISGSATACIGSGITLSETMSGGTWSSSNASATITTAGIVTGVTAGADTIVYTVINSCGSKHAIHIVNVSTLPSAGTISGTSTVCIGIGSDLSETVSGGTWSLSNGNASVSTSGVITGITSGADTVIYTVAGCGTSYTTYPILVSPLAVAGIISGSSYVCTDSTTVLTESVTDGLWSSSNVNATVSTSGVITGVSAGIDTIIYKVTNICGTTEAIKVITVNAIVSAGTITGADSVCVGHSITVADAIAGGTWLAANAKATISLTGYITGIAEGTDSITYSVTNPCGTSIAKYVITVLPASTCMTTATLIHYWDFNNFDGVEYTDTIHSIDAGYSVLDKSKAKILYAEMPDVSSSFSTYEDFYTTTPADSDNVNLQFGDTAGNALRVRNPSDSMYLLFYIPTTHFKNISLKYASEASNATTAMLYQDFDYSTDSGITWKTSGLSKLTDSAWLYFHLTSITFSDTSVDNNPNLVFRITFNGHTVGTKGNNRFDNVTVEGDSIGGTTVIPSSIIPVAIIQPVYKLYPNPVSNLLDISSNIDNEKSVMIYNTLGQVVYSGSKDGMNFSIDVTNLRSGSYFIHVIENTNGNITTMKFIKQ